MYSDYYAITVTFGYCRLSVILQSKRGEERRQWNNLYRCHIFNTVAANR